MQAIIDNDVRSFNILSPQYQSKHKVNIDFEYHTPSPREEYNEGSPEDDSTGSDEPDNISAVRTLNRVLRVISLTNAMTVVCCITCGLPA